MKPRGKTAWYLDEPGNPAVETPLATLAIEEDSETKVRAAGPSVRLPSVPKLKRRVIPKGPTRRRTTEATRRAESNFFASTGGASTAMAESLVGPRFYFGLACLVVALVATLAMLAYL